MVTTAAAAAEPGKLPLRKLPPVLALPLAVNLMGSCPADSPRAQAGCATLREKAAAAKCGGLWSLLPSPLNLQEQEKHHKSHKTSCDASLGCLLKVLHWCMHIRAHKGPKCKQEMHGEYATRQRHRLAHKMSDC